ncbi:MAG: hypothetical protein AAFQ82_00830 [Myxococcota bacterium]
MHRHINLCVLLVVSFGCSAAKATSPVHSPQTDPLAEVVSGLRKAYGASALRGLKTVTIKSDRRLAWPGQGSTAGFVEFATDRLYKHFDLQRKWGSVERWIHQSGNVYHDRQVLNGSGAYRVDYGEMTVAETESRGFDYDFAGDFRLSDTLLAMRIADGTAPTQFLGTQHFMGRAHAVLEVELAPEREPLRVFVDGELGLIHRVEIERSMGTVNLVFDGHTEQDGLRFATENRAYLGDILVEYENNLKMSFNTPVDAEIAVEPLGAPRPMFDTSKMSVQRLADDVYLVGQEDYSLFVEHEGHFIIVSTYPGVAERAAALESNLGRELSFSFAVVTHHHDNQLEGIKGAIALGAKIAATAETEKKLKKNSQVTADDLLILKDGSQLGPLSVWVKPTGHAIENAFVFHRASGVLFQDDHYHALHRDHGTRAQPTAIALHGYLERSSNPVRLLVSGHAGKAERWEVFEAQVEKAKRAPWCPSGRKICLDVRGRGDSG